MTAGRLPCLCRDCGWRGADAPDSGRCPACKGPRLVAHAELFDLAIAHVDCDAFYASVEKRDDRRLTDKPVIVGGGDRGVVTTACYLARIHGVRSAMPMVEARRRCPEAVIIKPRMAKYVAVSREIRELFDRLTPAVEPLSLDEAFLDLNGVTRLHGAPPAAVLNALAAEIAREIGVTVSIGLSWNKFLAKIASDLDKPRGMSVVGRAETLRFLADKPVSFIWGVGAATAAKLERNGYRTISDLRRAGDATLAQTYGSLGLRLGRLSRGEDARPVASNRKAKSISSETTFDRDLNPLRAEDRSALDGALWRLSEKVADRLKAAQVAGRVVTLALKTSAHKRLTRRRSLAAPTDLADDIYATAHVLAADCFDAPPSGTRDGRTSGLYRLIGVGVASLSQARTSDDAADETSPRFDALLEPERSKKAEVERAMDDIRKRFGDAAVRKGRALR